jgi:hypothetical protein
MAEPRKQRSGSISELAQAYKGMISELPLENSAAKAAEFKARRMAKAAQAAKQKSSDV